MESNNERVKRLYVEFERLGVPSVRAAIDVGRLGKNGKPSETEAAAHWLKLKSEEQINSTSENNRNNKRRWLITTVLSTTAFLFGMLGLATGGLALFAILNELRRVADPGRMKRLFTALIIGLSVLPIMTNVDLAATDLGNSAVDRLVIVVIDPPANFESVASELGYVVGDLIVLEELSVEVVEVGLPEGRSIDAAIKELEKHFPNLVIGDSEYYEVILENRAGR